MRGFRRKGCTLRLVGVKASEAMGIARTGSDAGERLSHITEEHCALERSKQKGRTRKQRAARRSQLIVHRTL